MTIILRKEMGRAFVCFKGGEPEAVDSIICERVYNRT